ncbi:MAG TPA: hypothetical protein VIG99_30405 [Myxococcaceae bacterium]|jgi:hypothetical protein
MGGRAAAICFVLASTALAEDQSHIGFEPTVLVGAGGFAPSAFMSSWAQGERKPSVAIHALLVYRVFRPFDIGLHVAHQWLNVTGLPDGASAYSSAAGGGMIVRFHPLSLAHIEWIDPSIGLGADMFAYSRQATQLPPDLDTEVRSAISGAALPLVAGLDVMVTEGFALSASAMWSPWFLAESCASQGTALPACQATSGAPEHYFFVGLGLRLHLRFVS